MKTGDEYPKALQDGRATYCEGERVDDVVAHPVLGVSVDVVARTYDRFYSPEPGAQSPIMAVPGSAAELRERIPLLHETDIVTHVTYQSIMTLTTAASRIASELPQYVDSIGGCIDRDQHEDRADGVVHRTAPGR